ncbi:FmdB family zinc ribbon protein [Ahniella affigens]|nr:zinc ribbon domain-containing protein [Ahniella affigens]
MPIYEYVAATAGEACDHCRNGFDELQRLSDSDLKFCPICTQPVVRRISAPALATSGSHLLKEDHFSKRGFTQYKRVEKGRYEKTAGNGPDTFSA